MPNKIDDLDGKILGLLKKDSRISSTKIAKELNISIATATRRIKKLIQQKIIKQFTVITDLKNSKYELIAFVLIETNPSHDRNLLEEFHSLEDILEIYHTSGQNNLFLKIRARDIGLLNSLIQKIRSLRGVENLQSSIILKKE